MNLRNWNIGMAALQFGMGGYLTWLFNDKGLIDKPIQLVTTGVAKVPSGTDSFTLGFVQKNSDQIFIARETIAFFFITGLFHSIYAYTNDTMYEKMIQNKNNCLRWLEYSISATLMMRIIAVQCGIRDRDTMSLITTSMIGVMLMGQIVEVAMASGTTMGPNQKNVAIVASVIGWVLMLGVFAVVIRKYIELQSDVDAFGCPKVKIPDFVLAIIVSQLALFSTFGLIQLYHVYQRINGNQVDYRNIEKLYIIDSLVAKLTLGGILAYSVTGADTGVYGSFKCT